MLLILILLLISPLSTASKKQKRNMTDLRTDPLYEVSLQSSLYIEAPLPLQHLKKMRNVLETFGSLERCDRIGEDKFVAKWRTPEIAIQAKIVLETYNIDKVSAPVFRVGWLADSVIEELLRVEAERELAAAKAEEERLQSVRCCLLENLFSPAEEKAMDPANWVGSLAAEVESQLTGTEVVKLVVDDWTTEGRVFILFKEEAAAALIKQRLGGRRFGPRVVRAHLITVGQMEKVCGTRQDSRPQQLKAE
jgi:hypothetical protein